MHDTHMLLSGLVKKCYISRQTVIAGLQLIHPLPQLNPDNSHSTATCVTDDLSDSKTDQMTSQ